MPEAPVDRATSSHDYYRAASLPANFSECDSPMLVVTQFQPVVDACARNGHSVALHHKNASPVAACATCARLYCYY